MSDAIRVIGMKMSQKGLCRKCRQPRDSGNHSRCDRWPVQYGIGRGFHYVANSRDSTIARFKDIARMIVAGEADDTLVSFEIRIRQVPEPEEEQPTAPATLGDGTICDEGLVRPFPPARGH